MMKKQMPVNQFKGEAVAMISLGCARNTVDSEKILSQAQAQGARISSVQKASTLIVNTCAFTKEAKVESLGVISELIERKKKGAIKRIIVHGCLSERYSKELKQNFSDVDAFVGVADFKKDFNATSRLTPCHYAFVKISEGCANLCSYCAIPSIKGPLKSRPQISILKELSALEDTGVKELVIIGQDITLYGRDRSSQETLADLLKKILKVSGFPWVRLLYLNPRRLTPDLLDFLAGEKRIVPYIDMPLQHVSDRILKLMNRGITKKEIEEVIATIRRRLPQAALRTAFIVGFPSETQREFDELCDFVRETKFDKLGAFKYSREEGTKAYSFGGQRSEKIKEERYEKLMSMQKDISADLLFSKRGQTIEAIVEEKQKDVSGQYLGRTIWDAPEVDGVVFLQTPRTLKVGSIVRAKITDSYEYDLVGEVVG